MSFLIDTTIISEVRKGARCNPGVAKWWAEVAEGGFHTLPGGEGIGQEDPPRGVIDEVE